MQKGVKFRIYPNKQQKMLINRTLGCCRLVYNKGLSLRNEMYKAGTPANYTKTSKALTDWKRQDNLTFLKEVDSIALQQSLRDLDHAFQNFFQKHSGYPVWKSKHNHRQSYRTLNQNNGIRIVGNYLRLPKLGFVRVKQSMEIGKIHHVTITRTPTNKYFAILNIEFTPEPRKNRGGQIGLDVGIKTFYTDSNGRTVENPKYLETAQKRLAKAQRKLSRKRIGSKNYQKQRVQVALLHEKVANQRNDFLQKQSSILMRENQTICIENLKISNMVRNHRLAQAIRSVSWSRFFTMLIYKASWYGNEIVKVPSNYPSSQICSVCGYQHPLVKNLGIRQWTCPQCHTAHDRDHNASINILRKGLQQLALS